MACDPAAACVKAVRIWVPNSAIAPGLLFINMVELPPRAPTLLSMSLQAFHPHTRVRRQRFCTSYSLPAALGVALAMTRLACNDKTRLPAEM